MKRNLRAAGLASVLAIALSVAGCSEQNDAVHEEGMAEGENHAAHEEAAHEDATHDEATFDGGNYEGEDHAAHYAEHHADDIAAAINAEDRADAERARDEFRLPEITLAFSQIEPGSRVMDVGSGAGYYTMLISGLVGSEGHVTGQSPQIWVDRYGADWPEVQGAKMEARDNIDFVVAEFDNLGVTAGSLDAITFMLTYHDAALLPIDRAVMNQSFYDALRPGGLLLISDHVAPDHTTPEQIDAVHRIDAGFVQAEIEAAGFELIATSDTLANADDDHTLNIYHPDIRGYTDRFLLLFQKPE